MTTTIRLWWVLRRREARADRLPAALAVLAFAVSTAALLVALGGWRAFDGRADAKIGGDYSTLYLVLAQLCVALMVVPILTLGGVAARLCVSRRHARLAALRLTGATTGQVGGLTLLECASQAAVGAVFGVGAYAAALAPLSLLTFQGRQFTPAELWVGPVILVGVVVAVLLLAAISGVFGLARVAVTPLGVAARSTPPALSAVRLVALALMLLVWLVMYKRLGDVAIGVGIALLAMVIAALNLAGPYVVMLIGRMGAKLARTPATLLAARRIVDDPASTWRSVSALGLGVTVAALSSVTGAAAVMGPAITPEEQMLVIDIGTGAIVSLTIISVVAATSTGVVHAARVLDQAPQYRALALAGAPMRLLHRARSREIVLPLFVTISMSLALPMVIVVPMTAEIGAWFFLPTFAAIVVACLFTVAAAAASRPLIHRVARC